MASLSSIFILVCLTTQTGASWFNRNSISSLPDEIDHIIAACQEDNLSIQCHNRYNKIIIKDVFYGRDNLFTCTSKIFNATELCSHPTPRNIVEKVHTMCNNENKCKVPVTTTFLQKDGEEEICFGIRKYLKVQYACHQMPQLHMVCPSGCSDTCWPMCQTSCCSPVLPKQITITTANNTNITNTNDSSILFAIAHQQMLSHSLQQCGGDCPSSCAPLCQPTCCGALLPSLMVQPNTVSACPGTCSGSCLPLCDPTCCLMKKAQQLTVQVAPTCPGQCPTQCAPLCSPACCSGPMPMAPAPQPVMATCPTGCAAQCAPTCQPSCCVQSPMMMSPPPTCGVGCAASCAPLCQPTCCQTMMALPQPPQQMYQKQQLLPKPRASCPTGCPGMCLPMCQPTCCSQGGSMPQQPMMLPPAQMPQMQAMPQMTPMILPQQAMSGGCPATCSQTNCQQPACPSRCCKREDMETTDNDAGLEEGVAPGNIADRENFAMPDNIAENFAETGKLPASGNFAETGKVAVTGNYAASENFATSHDGFGGAQNVNVDPYEVAQRKTYQQMLTHFRKKQLQRYFHGK